GLGTKSYPAIGPVGGKNKVFYTSGQTIVMQDIDLLNAKVYGTPTVVYRPIQAGATPITPSPLVGGDGDVEGLFLAEEQKPWIGLGTGDSDMVWANDLDPSTPGLMFMSRTDWSASGGVAGGFIYWTHDVGRPLFFHLMHAEGAWLLGDDEPVGGTANIDTGAVNFSAPSPLFSIVFAAAKPGPPFPVPKMLGLFALDLASFVQLAVFSTTHPDGTAGAMFSIPPDPGLKGTSFALQAILVETKKRAYTLSNTGWLHIR
ncbi:MAG: hypothetical protein ACE5F1_12995, partial [Planctomycetota bacterium]